MPKELMLQYDEMVSIIKPKTDPGGSEATAEKTDRQRDKLHPPVINRF